MQALDALRETKARLAAAGIVEAEREAALLCAHVLDVEPGQLALHLGTSLDERSLSALLEQRLLGQPLQYVLGVAGFMGLDFSVGPGVLIPRPDTEIVAERAIALLKEHSAPLVADICSGCGTIAVSLAHYLPQAQVYGVDISPQTLLFAEHNARSNRVQERCRFLPGDLCAPLIALGLRFDLIVCNPPYVTQAEMAELSPEVKQEPELALLGGADGLDFYRRLATEAAPLLKPGGSLLLEHGWQQQQALAMLLEKAGWQVTALLKDYGGRQRAVMAWIDSNC